MINSYDQSEQPPSIKGYMQQDDFFRSQKLYRTYLTKMNSGKIIIGREPFFELLALPAKPILLQRCRLQLNNDRPDHPFFPKTDYKHLLVEGKFQKWNQSEDTHLQFRSSLTI